MEWKNTWLNYLLILGIALALGVLYYAFSLEVTSTLLVTCSSIFMIALLFSVVIYNKTGLTHEEKFALFFDEEFIACKHPEKPDETIAWKEISEVIVLTTDKGPHEPYIWILLSSDNGSVCKFPLGAKNSRDLLEKILGMKGFDLKLWAEAMKSVENKTFLTWKKPIRR